MHALLLCQHGFDDVRVQPRVQWQVDDDHTDDRGLRPVIEVTLQPAVAVIDPLARTAAAAEDTHAASVPKNRDRVGEQPRAQAQPPKVPPDIAVAPLPAPPPSSSAAGTSSWFTTASSVPVPDPTPARLGSGSLMKDVVTGLEAAGPRPSTKALGEALDYQPESERDQKLSGGKLAAARANRALKRDLAFHDVTVGLADDWFRTLKDATERHFRPTPGDLDNPAEVTRVAIVANYLKDPSSWDDDARAALEPFLQADRLASKNPIERLALGNSASLGQANDTLMRRSTIDDLLRRKDAGLAVRFAFEVDVHHAADGAITAIDVLRTEFERALVEKVRLAVQRAVQAAPPVPAQVAHGRPFLSRWLLVATWYLDPPRPHFASSNSLFTDDGTPPPFMISGTFDVAQAGISSSSVDVKMKSSAELLLVTPLL